MPALVVVGGAMSVYAGATMFTAAAGWTLANVAAGAMIAGGAMSVYGAATGNEGMIKQGQQVSLAGGVVGVTSSLTGIGTNAEALASQEMGASLNQTAGGIDMANNPNAAASGFDPNAGVAPTDLGGSSAELGVDALPQSESLNVAGDAGNAVARTADQQALDRLVAIQEKGTVLDKYDQLVNVAGGIADYYAQDEATKVERERLAFEQQKYQDSVNNVNSDFTVNMKTPLNKNAQATPAIPARQAPAYTGAPNPLAIPRVG